MNSKKKQLSDNIFHFVLGLSGAIIMFLFLGLNALDALSFKIPNGTQIYTAKGFFEPLNRPQKTSYTDYPTNYSEEPFVFRAENQTTIVLNCEPFPASNNCLFRSDARTLKFYDEQSGNNYWIANKQMFIEYFEDAEAKNHFILLSAKIGDEAIFTRQQRIQAIRSTIVKARSRFQTNSPPRDDSPNAAQEQLIMAIFFSVGLFLFEGFFPLIDIVKHLLRKKGKCFSKK